MHASNAPGTLRRSSRVPITVPILVTSLEPSVHFSEICETLVVSAHGCAIRTPIRLETGLPVHFHSREGRETVARVVHCEPMGTDQEGWRLGARLDQPDNFWGLKACPEDWARLLELPPASEQKPISKLPAMNTGKKDQSPNRFARSLTIVPEKAQKEPSDDHLKAVVAECVRPLQAELTDLREKLARGEPKRSQFEVSLSHIPPELEDKLWIRLRQDLGAQVLHQTREHSEQVLRSAKTAIAEKISEAQNEFRQQVIQEVRTIEQRAQSLSADLTDKVRQQLRTGLAGVQQQLEDAGARLEQRAEELLGSLQERLSEEHDAHRWEMQQVQAAVASESSRVQSEIADLDRRIAKLAESAHRLESDLDGQLAQMAKGVISSTRTQLQAAVDVVLKEVGRRNAQELGNQLDEACAHLKILQKGIEASVPDLLRTQVADALQSFKQTMEGVAQHSVGRWRLALARDLNSLGKILGEQFELEAVSDDNEND